MGILDIPGYSQHQADLRFSKAGSLPTALVAAGGSGPYNQKADLYNFKPDNTRRLRWSLARALSKQGICRWAFVGDSTMAGYSDPTYSVPRLLLDALEKQGYPVAGTGPVVANPGGSAGVMVDPRWSFTGPWTAQGGAASPNYVRTVASTGATATFTSDRKGTVVKVAHFCTQPVNWTIDGVAQTQIPASGAGTITYTTVTGLSDAVHTVVLTTTGSSNFNLVYCDVGYTTYGLSFMNAGTNSTRAADWTNSTYYYGGPATIAWLPHVTFISLGHNDKNVGGGVDVATFKASTQTLIDNFKQSNSSNVVLVAQNPNQTGDFSDYNKAKYELADSNNIPLIDIYHRWGESYATASATGFTADGAHPNAIGYGDTATAFLAAITG